jgi:hypothetical protein
VLFQPLCQLDSIVLIIRLQTTPQRHVILFLNQQIVISFIDDCDIEFLGSDKVRLDEWKVVFGLKDLDYSTMVQTGG